MSQGGSFMSPSPTPPPEMSFTADKSDAKLTEESRDLVYLQMMNQIQQLQMKVEKQSMTILELSLSERNMLHDLQNKDQ